MPFPTVWEALQNPALELMSLEGANAYPLGNQASLDSRNYGYATLTKLLKASGLFQLDKEGTSEVSVRDIRQARGSKT